MRASRIIRSISFVLSAVLLLGLLPLAVPAPAVAAVVVPSADLRSVKILSATEAVAVAYDGTIWRSVTGGESWTKVRNADSYQFNAVDFWDGGDNGVAVTASGKVARTTDRGRTWSNVSFSPYEDMDGDFPNEYSHNAVACIPGTATYAVSVGGDPNPSDGTEIGELSMRSTSSLSNWKQPFWTAKPYKYDDGLGNLIDVGEGEFFDVDFVDSIRGWAVGVDYFRSATKLTDTASLYKTSNAAVSWSKVTFSYPARLATVSFGSATSGVVVGHLVSGGAPRIYYTTNGGTSWTERTPPDTSVTLRAVHMDTSSTGWIVGSNGTVLRTTNSGSSWTAVKPTGYTGSLYDVDFRDGRGIAVGMNAVLVTSDGITWTVPTGPNSAPVANDDSYAALKNTPLTVPTPGILANDTDADGDMLSVSQSSDPSSGSLSMNPDGSFTYTPQHNYVGTVTFTYRASDGVATSNLATVTIVVSNTNEPPVAYDDSYNAVKNIPLSVSAPGVLANDTDGDGNPLVAVLATGPSHGVLTFNSNGSFTYTPVAGYTGPDSFTYTATDGIAPSPPATVTITVNNTAPVAVADSYSVSAGGSLSVAEPGVLGNDYDSNGDPLTAVRVSGPSNGTLALSADGSFSYTPATGFAGVDTFTYKVYDGSLYSAAVAVSITVSYPTLPDGAIRVAGPNRYATSVEASKRGFPDGARTIVIATGANWPDALGGSALAGAVDGPLLLTKPDALPSEVTTEIKRLGATKAYILGSTASVSADVEKQLKGLGLTVIRKGGSNRYETARMVADETIRLLGSSYEGHAFVATGLNFPDATGAAPVAAALGRPILLANVTAGTVSLTPAVNKVVILGSTAAVPAKVETYLDTKLGSANVSRLAGANRYDTAARAAQLGVDAGMRWDGTGLATGLNFPDALSGGAMLGKLNSVMLLTRPDTLSGEARTKLSTNRAVIDTLFIFGDTNAVSSAVETAAKSAATVK